jgi:predicted cupin superfamily sugar epimerase
MTPAQIIETLGMQRHPEGGWYAETFRDAEGGARGHSTAIYYLLETGERSHWHRVTDATEVWLYHAGDPLRLSLSADGRAVETHVLGPDVVRDQRPQIIVPAGWWQSAAPIGGFTLVSCTVAPGFTFESFEMAPPDWQPGS